MPLLQLICRARVPWPQASLQGPQAPATFATDSCENFLRTNESGPMGTAGKCVCLTRPKKNRSGSAPIDYYISHRFGPRCSRRASSSSSRGTEPYPGSRGRARRDISPSSSRAVFAGVPPSSCYRYVQTRVAASVIGSLFRLHLRSPRLRARAARRAAGRPLAQLPGAAHRGVALQLGRRPVADRAVRVLDRPAAAGDLTCLSCRPGKYASFGGSRRSLLARCRSPPSPPIIPSGRFCRKFAKRSSVILQRPKTLEIIRLFRGWAA